MKYVITPHARGRMKERGISPKNIEDALQFPDGVLHDNKERLLFKKIYEKNGEKRLLLVAGEQKDGAFEVITVIETSKIKKYL